MIIEYSSKYIKGVADKKVFINVGFLPTIHIIEDVCKAHKFIFWVTNSFRKEKDVLKGTVVNPAAMSNHKVGHALDGNLQNTVTGEWFASVKMGDGTGDDEKVIRDIVAKGVRFGGDFRKEDNVHFDDALNIKNPKEWLSNYNKLQVDK